MKRDPIWTAIEVALGGLGLAIAIGVVAALNAAIDWWRSWP